MILCYEVKGNAAILLAITTAMFVHALDDLAHSVYAGGFGDSFHEGIVSPMIRQVNPPIISKSESLISKGF
jgi:hypothetical protein